MTQLPMPLADPANVVCRRCTAPLAADQRYCLSCGARVAEPRVAYLDLLAGGAGGTLPAADAGAGVSRSFARQLERVGGPMGAAAVVLVALGVGFLLGQGSANQPAPQVVRPVVNVQNTGGTATGGGTTSGGSTSSGKHHGSGDKGGAGTKGVAKVSDQQTGGDINKLQQQPDQQATQGPPPKKDHKPAGGGSPTETIG